MFKNDNIIVQEFAGFDVRVPDTNTISVMPLETLRDNVAVSELDAQYIKDTILTILKAHNVVTIDDVTFTNIHAIALSFAQNNIFDLFDVHGNSSEAYQEFINLLTTVG